MVSRGQRGIEMIEDNSASAPQTGLSSLRDEAGKPSSPKASIPSAVSIALNMLTERERALAEMAAPIMLELEEIRRAIRAFSGDGRRSTVRSRPNAPAGLTIQDAIKEALAQGPNKADRLFPLVRFAYGRDLIRESIAPQLSRLLAKGEVDHARGVWSLSTQAIETRSAVTAGHSPQGESAVAKPCAHGEPA